MIASNHALVWSRLQLRFKGGRRAVGFDLSSIGELQFLRGVLMQFAERFPSDLIWMFHHYDTAAAFREMHPEFDGRICHLSARCLSDPCFERLDLYVTTEQFWGGPPGVFTVSLFHGQPSKGVVFAVPHCDPLQVNDAFFLYGPLQRQALEEHLAIHKLALPQHLSLFEIGYTKSDELLSGKFDRQSHLEALGLEAGKTTILYAPAFNDGASLRECGVAILDTLCSMKQFNILAKLPIDCLQPTTNAYATGGVDWFEIIGKFEKTHSNFRLIRDLQADRALFSADVMITCVSGIAFEFLALGKPVIYVDTPEFFTRYLRGLFPDLATDSWVTRTTVNGGREFGLLVSSPSELPDAISEVLAHPDKYPRQKENLLSYLLYNPGKATEAAVQQMDLLLRQKVRSRRTNRSSAAVARSRLAQRMHSASKRLIDAARSQATRFKWKAAVRSLTPPILYNMAHTVKQRVLRSRAAPVAAHAAEQWVSPLVAQPTASPDNAVQEARVDMGAFTARALESADYRVEFDRALARHGYALTRTGGGYLDATTTIRAAREAGLTLQEFVHRHDSEHKKGRTDRIANRIAALFDPRLPIAVAEIGTGTGMYMERLCKASNCVDYHIFETDPGWQEYARTKLSAHAPTSVHNCDGMTLKELNNRTIDLVHAHGVFVYTPSLVTLGYLAEAARVLRVGGKLYFDCYLDTNFGPQALQNWMASEWRFPVITASKILFDFLERNRLKIVGSFREVHGPDYVDYLIIEKSDGDTSS